MSRKRQKQIHKEIYDRCYKNYEYNSDYNPMNEICCDNGADLYDIYGTFFSTHDKTDYSAYPMRGYIKKTDEAKGEDK